MIKKTKTQLKNKIRKQMYLNLIPLIVLPVLFIGTFLTFYFAKDLYQQTVSQLESDNLRVQSILLDCVINIYNTSDDLINDKTLQDLITQDYTNDADANKKVSSYERLQSYLKKNTSFASITVYSMNPTIPDTLYIKQSASLPDMEWFSKVKVPSGCTWINYLPNKEDPRSMNLTFMRSIPLPRSEYPAILVISVSTNYLKNRIQNNSLFTAISLNEDSVFFCTTRSLQGQQQFVTIDYNKKYYMRKGLLSFQGKKVLGDISSLPIYKSDNTFYITTIDMEAYNSIVKIMMMCIIITIIAIVTPLTGILYYTKIFSSRVIALRKSMNSAKIGQYDIIDTLRGDDELTETFLDLKSMIQEIKAKEAQMYNTLLKEKEMTNQQQKMEFKILASQINPHFINNTLETIRMLAIDNDDFNVASAIKLLGKSMHYVLENTEVFSTTLSKELDYIEVYLQIQKLRFNERINYSIEIQEGFIPGDYQILPLLLQPIVENAVLHGLEKITTDGFIKISIHTDDKALLYIDILDNGRGMTQEELTRLNSQLIQKSDNENSSIGLNNINRRIKLFYGEEYSMNIQSSVEFGTYVRLILPLLPLA